MKLFEQPPAVIVLSRDEIEDLVAELKSIPKKHLGNQLGHLGLFLSAAQESQKEPSDG